MTCAICHVRKPRRECPGVRGEICTVCCGTEREQSIDCPLDCSWLHEAHEHERPPDLDAASLPNRDVEVTEEFLRENEVLLAFLAVSVFEGAMKSPGTTDQDVREAFEALIATWKTLQSGIDYETQPANLFAAAIAKHVRARIDEVREKEAQAGDGSSLRDTAILGVMVFLQRLEYSRNNGRWRSRAFLDFLRAFYTPSEETDEGRVAGADEPLIIL